MEKMFFELLQVAIGSRQSLPVLPTKAEWQLLYDMATKQALVGVCFAGVQRLGPSATMELPEALRLRWLGMAAKIQQRSQRLNEECARVCREFAHDGVQCVVLKGQSNLVYYPQELREARTAGDIDLWCKMETPSVPLHRGKNHPDGVSVGQVSPLSRGVGGVRVVIEYCKQYERCQGREIPWHRVLYYHCELTSPSGIGIEPHYRPTYLCSPLRNWRLQRWFRENEQWGLEDAKIVGCVFPVATVSFNAVYQLLHIYKHLFEGGIGLRQLLDYYFVLRALHVEQGEFADRTESMAQWAEGMGISVKSNEEIMHLLGRLGMRKFSSAVMYVLQEVFGMPDVYLLCESDEIEGRFLLNEIMQAGNFGKYDQRIAKTTSQMGHAWEKLKHNMRLVGHYPEEVVWEPVFRVYHWIWRKFELWRY